MRMGTEFWAAHVAAAEQEGISASEYARRHGLAVEDRVERVFYRGLARIRHLLGRSSSDPRNQSSYVLSILPESPPVCQAWGEFFQRVPC